MDGEEHHSLSLLVQVSLNRKYVDTVNLGEDALIKKLCGFPSPGGMLLIKLSLGGNN